MDKRSWLLVLVVVVAVWGAGMGFLLKLDLFRQEYNKYEDRGVARINITLNGVLLEEINGGSKETKYEGNELTLYNEGIISDFEDVEVKGRGNGTWVQEKKPYQIRFKDKVDLFGLGKARKWCLLANAMDGTNLRTEIAFDVAEMLRMKYAMKGEFVELYVNGDYEGLYYLTHVVEIGKATVDLKGSFGVLMELDNLYWQVEDYRSTRNGDKFVAKDIKSKDVYETVVGFFMKAYNNFELAVEKKDFNKIKEIVDVDSLAEYYLISEFSVNPDAYWTSFYFYMDGPDDKIHAGPAWDFDLAFGNRRWGNWLGEAFYSPTETMVRKRELLTEEEYKEKGLEEWLLSRESLSEIMFRLTEVPEFMERVREIFRERMSGRKEELIKMIELESDQINEAALENNRMWGDVSYWDEVNDVISWIKKRYDYFEQEYGGLNNRDADDNIRGL